MSKIALPSPFGRGGMCKNPFGGEERIDRINLLEFLESNATPDKVLYSCIVQDAVSNYLYAFLGKNGTSAEEFFSAWQYFFKVVSTDKSSWNHHRTIKLIYINRGERVVENRYLTDNELQLMCFDKHYDLSELSKHMHIDKFRAKLKTKRRKILNENWEQVKAYINTLYQHELGKVAGGQQVPLQVWNEDLLEVLIDPPTPLHLANIIYVPNRLKRTSKARTKKELGESMYIQLVERLESNIVTELDANWGPLSKLRERNDQTANSNSSNSIHSDPH